MNWQMKTRTWGRTVLHSGRVCVETGGECIRLLPGHLYLLPEELPFTAWGHLRKPNLKSQ